MDKGNEKNSWDKLSIREKAQYFQQAIAQGITDRKEIIDTYNTQSEEQKNIYWPGGELKNKITDAKNKLSSIVKKTKDAFAQATLKAAMADRPEIMQAAGWDYNKDGNIVQGDPNADGAKALSNSLAAISTVPNIIVGGKFVPMAYSSLPSGVKLGIDAVGAIDGLRNAASKEGVRKTINYARNRQYGRAALSGLGDAFDIAGTGDLVRIGKNIANPAYRAYHAYNTIYPMGYDKPLERAKTWLSSMIENRKYTKPNYDITEEFVKMAGNESYAPFAKVRDDAWRIYLGMEPKNGFYIKNTDGTWSYNLDKLKNMREAAGGDFGEAVLYALENKYDFLGHSHGGLWDSLTSFVPKYEKQYGNLPGNFREFGMASIGDRWDLNPFERAGDKVLERINSKAKGAVGTAAIRQGIQNFRKNMYDRGHWGYNKDFIGKLTSWLDNPLNALRSGYKIDKNGKVIAISPTADNIIDKLTTGKVADRINKMVSKFEAGPILGGKPFIMKTTFPFTKIYDFDYASKLATKTGELGIHPYADQILMESPYKSYFNNKFNNFNITDLSSLRINNPDKFADGGLLDSWRKLVAPTYKTDSFGEAFSQAKSAGKPYFKWNGNRYNTITEVEQWRANNPEIDTPQFAHDDMVNRIMAEENSKDNKDGGYNKQNKRWYWHKSVEGGAPTIAWGFKKGMDKDVDRLADSQGGYLTEEQADSLLDVKVNRTLNSAKRYYDKKFGEGSWDLLSPKTQSILGDYQYNPGLSKFPSFTKAAHDGDLDTMYKEYKRYTDKKELGRNKTIKNDLDKIAGGYYTIFKVNNK